MFTVVSAILVAPAVVLAGFTAFLFDDPDAGATSWVLAIPFMTLPLAILACVPASWLLHRSGRSRAALRVAAYPIVHLGAAILVVIATATLS